jgi:hypothetical protein
VGVSARRHAVLAAAAVVVVFLAGCTGASSGGGNPATTPTAAPSAPGKSGIPTGTQLQALLPYHAGQPAGWQLSSPSSARNSGGGLQQPLGLASDSSNCIYVSLINNAVSVLQNWWSVSWADSLLQNAAGSYGGVDMALGAFQPGYAQQQVSWYATAATRCHSSVQDGSPVTTTSSTPAGLGDQALYLQNAISAGPESYMTQTLLVRVGGNLAAVYQNGSTAALLPLPQFEAMAQLLVQQLHTLPAAG